MLDRLAALEWPAEPWPLLRMAARVFLEFAAEDPARAQLLFQRNTRSPASSPHRRSFALAVEALEWMRARLAGIGITGPAPLDLWTALVAGLAQQQLANDPGGDR